MPVLEHTEEDLRDVARQIGRPPRGRWAVAQRCHLGVPMVVENHPVLDDGSPFPTLFWLTCPILVKRASGMESEGRMQSLNQLLSRSEALRAAAAEAGDRLRQRRDEHEVIAESAAPPGGIDRVKCLHAHVAQELADPPNPIGALALADAGWPDCVVPCVEAAT